ncbi:MAG: hypothetical protein H0Z35_13595 [Thermoanaerobacteraceae bacterium]|nr:hypothetical protein [Thermoanaerobacteraceae bacterium]
MERKISLIIGFLVGIGFMFIPINRTIFESFTGLIDGFFYLAGLAIVTVLGFVLVKEAFRDLK